MADENLEKLTVTKLREIALEIPEIKGVHGMSKEDLIKAIREARGEAEPAVETPKPVKKKGKKEKVIPPKSELKKQRNELKAKRDEARASSNRKEVNRLRRRIKRLKRLTKLAS